MGNPAAGGHDDETCQAVLDILRGEADVVVRMMERPEDIGGRWRSTPIACRSAWRIIAPGGG